MTAEHIVFAIALPLVNIPGLYFMKVHQERSYALGTARRPAVDGMFIGEGGGFSFRTYEDFLLVGGGGHRTGRGRGRRKATARSAAFADAAYPGCVGVLRVGDAGLHEPGRHCPTSACTGVRTPASTWQPGSASGG